MDIMNFFKPKPAVPMAESIPLDPMGTLGVTGLHISNGYVYEEFIPELQGDRGKRTYREMVDNDDVIGAVHYATERLIQAIEWTPSPSDADTSGAFAEFVEEVFSDMSDPFREFIAEVITQDIFGFAAFEIVFKKRSGPDALYPQAKSQFSDGRIGIHKLAPRAQESIERWDRLPNGDIMGFWQYDPNGAPIIYIPMEKAVLFRTTSRKDNPEGRSLLRSAYRPWYIKKNIEWVEAIGIERDLAGLPVIRVPGEILTNSANAVIKNEYIKMARDLKNNEQGGVVIPSDTYKDGDGKPTNIPKVTIELLSSAGTKSINTNDVVMRYNRAIATTFLADFMMLGSGDTGSFALSKSKTQLFIRAVQGLVNGIADTINRDLLPKLWAINGFKPELMPKMVPGHIAPQDLVELGDYISKLAGAGLVFGGDPETEKVLRQAADLPESVEPADVMAFRDLLTPPELQQDANNGPDSPIPPGNPGGQ